MDSELKKLVEENFSLLRKVSDEAHALKSVSDGRTAFIYRHARSIYRLGQDVIFLLEANRPDSCPIIVRAMLEDLFKLVAAVKKQETAVQIIISEVEDEIERTKKCFNTIDAAPIIRNLSDFAEKLRKEHDAISTKKWNTFECADAAELGQMYSGEYFVFSKHAHATTSGIILRENKIGVGHVLQTILTIVTYTTTGFLQTIKTSSPEGHIKEVVRLAKETLKLNAEDVFCKMDRPKDGSHPTG
jgi:uncharacterized protein DUF5677